MRPRRVGWDASRFSFFMPSMCLPVVRYRGLCPRVRLFHIPRTYNLGVVRMVEREHRRRLICHQASGSQDQPNHPLNNARDATPGGALLKVDTCPAPAKAERGAC